MHLEKALIVAALGGLAYLYLTEEEAAANGGDINCGPVARLKTNEEGQKICEPKLKCKEGFKLSPDMTQCLDIENPCGKGFKYDKETDTCNITDEICGDRCYKLNEAQDDCIKIAGCGTATGSEIGDMAMYMAQGLALGVVYDQAGKKIFKVAERKLTAEAQRVAAKKASGQSTKLATQVAGKRLGQRAGEVAAKRSAIAIATKAAKILGRRIAVQLAKIATVSSTGIGVLVTPLMILSTSLSVGLTAAGVFFEVPPGYTNVRQWDDIPEAGQVAITALPIIGDVIDMVMPYIFFTDGCAPGLEDQNGLCYEPPHKDFRCEAFLCYAKPEAMVGYKPENFLSNTYQFVVKKILTDTGTIPNVCPPGRQHGVEGPGFCYDTQSEPGNIVLGTWWEHCKPGERDDLAFCAKEHIDPCGPGEWEVGRDCWGNRTDHIIDCFNHPMRGGNCHGGGNCRTWGDGCCWRGAFGECWPCVKTECDPIRCDPITPCGTTAINMPELRRTFAARNFRFESRPKASRVLAPHGNICVPPRSQEIAGLCYPDLGKGEGPPGYRRQAIGTLEPDRLGDRPEWHSLQNYRGLDDIGVSFSLPTYTRPPFPKIGIYPKRRQVIEDTPDPPKPPYCGDLNPLELPETDPQYKQRLCREEKPPEGYELSGDALSFHKKCRDLYKYNFENTNCEWIDENGDTQSYPNAEGLIQVEYDFR